MALIGGLGDDFKHVPEYVGLKSERGDDFGHVPDAVNHKVLLKDCGRVPEAVGHKGEHGEGCKLDLIGEL